MSGVAGNDIRSTPQSTLSLLKRALVLRGSQDGVAVKHSDDVVRAFPVPPHLTLARIKEGLRRIPENPFAPLTFFDLVRSILAIDRGALLLREFDSGRFSPWIQEGYDHTTQRRLRVAEERVVDMFTASAMQPVILEPGNWADMTAFFSVRDAGPREHLVLGPLLAEGEIVAILLVQRSPFVAASRSITSLIISGFSNAAGELIHNGRDRRFATVRLPIVHRSYELRRRSYELDAGGRAFDLIAAAIDLSALHQDLPTGSDKEHLARDAERALAVILSGLGDVAVDPTGTVYCISLPHKSKARPDHPFYSAVPDVGLLQQHLRFSLKAVFGDAAPNCSIRMLSVNQGNEDDSDDITGFFGAEAE